jgi:cold shock CspA family protein
MEQPLPCDECKSCKEWRVQMWQKMLDIEEALKRGERGGGAGTEGDDERRRRASVNDAREGIAMRRLERLEKTQEEEDDEQHLRQLASHVEDGVEAGKFMVGWATKWFAEKGFGFAEVLSAAGRVSVFVHTSAVRGAAVLRRGERVVVKVILDPSRPTQELSYKATEAWHERDWREDQEAEVARRRAEWTRKAADLAASMARRAEEATEGALNGLRRARLRMVVPPGLDSSVPTSAAMTAATMTTTTTRVVNAAGPVDPGDAITVSSSTSPLQSAGFLTESTSSRALGRQRHPTEQEKRDEERKRKEARNTEALDKARFAYEWAHQNKHFGVRGPQCKGLRGLLESYSSSWKPGAEGEWALRWCENHGMRFADAKREQEEWLQRMEERRQALKVEEEKQAALAVALKLVLASMREDAAERAAAVKRKETEEQNESKRQEADEPRTIEDDAQKAASIGEGKADELEEEKGQEVEPVPFQTPERSSAIVVTSAAGVGIHSQFPGSGVHPHRLDGETPAKTLRSPRGGR